MLSLGIARHAVGNQIRSLYAVGMSKYAVENETATAYFEIRSHKLTKEYKRILTIRKNRSATASLATVNNNNIAPSPLRVVVPPPSAERLKQLLESDVSDRAEAVLANGSRLSKSNSQPPQWFASNSRVPR